MKGEEEMSNVEDLKKGYCPHFREVMDLNDCFFCYFKKATQK